MQNFFSKSMDLKGNDGCLNDGKRAFNIYSFNAIGYDYFLIGDIHSDTVSLKRTLQISNFFSNVVEKRKERLIFLGDYVDRGKAHIKTLEYILALKFIFPDYVYLLKGNHDDGVLIQDEIKLCVGKPDNESDGDYFLLYLDSLLKNNNELRLRILNSYLNFFDSLCNIAFLNNQSVSLMAVHGGIPRPRKNDLRYYSYINCIFDFKNNEIINNINKNICNNIMLWSDPWSGEDEPYEKTLGD